ncbi:sugar phosphate isomerase/epimerase family protein [Blastopirellula marina]|uniref:Xylose isomerase n=1 Tax=Blastopirellula marina TaxID=124 RepID=A0A2S8GME7_9BACT|nr:sugar phosphate isomerase/epimerase family protein [Blastopirellula marina]PQO45609.1 xylose isomerase [Blastopirellula marina]
MSTLLDRRHILSLSAAGALASLGLGHLPRVEAAHNDSPTIRYCFNTSTIRGQNLPIEEEVDIAAKAGYSGIEPWISKIEAYQKSGKSLADLKKRIADSGLKVESAIGFAQWIVDDPDKRQQGLEHAKRDMDLLAQIGGTRIAAPPAGATNGDKLDLLKVAQRYHALLEVGQQAGVVPELELWGFSKNLSRLGEVAMVVVEANHPDACMMPDVYHIYKGGSAFSGLSAISGHAIPVFHMNDYPANPPREQINDSARVFPGDGVAPLTPMIQTLLGNGFAGVFSLELFNPEYWKRDALEVAKEGLDKMQACVAEATA